MCISLEVKGKKDRGKGKTKGSGSGAPPPKPQSDTSDGVAFYNRQKKLEKWAERFSGKFICILYNKGRCPRGNSCPYAHVCQRCQKEPHHPVFNCREAPVLK